MLKSNCNPAAWEKSGTEELRGRLRGFGQITASTCLGFPCVKRMEGLGGETWEVYQLPGSEQ